MFLMGITIIKWYKITVLRNLFGVSIKKFGKILLLGGPLKQLDK